MTVPATSPTTAISPTWINTFGVFIRSPFQCRIDSLLLKLRIEPAEPIDNSEPADPNDRIEPAEPIDNSEPAEPIEAIDPAEPTEDTAPTEPSD